MQENKIMAFAEVSAAVLDKRIRLDGYQICYKAKLMVGLSRNDWLHGAVVVHT